MVTLMEAWPSVSETTSSGTPMASNSEAHECRSSWMLQCPRPASLQIRGTDLPNTSGSSGVPIVDVKTKAAGLRHTRAVMRSSS